MQNDQRRVFWRIENKILVPFVAITMVSTMIFAAILYYNGYKLKLEKETTAANATILSIERDLNLLFPKFDRDTLLQKYKDVAPDNIFFIDARGRILVSGRPLTEEGLARDSVIATSRNNPFGWEICYSLDTAKFQNDLIEEQKYMILATIALLLIIVQSSIFIAHNIAEPLRQLSAACADISLGQSEADVRVRDHIHRKDEVGQLSASFQTMIDSINAHTREINAVKLLNESIVRNLPIGIIAFDANHQLLFVNPKAHQLLENTAFLQNGATLFEIISDLVQKNTPTHESLRLQSADGTPRELELGLWRLAQGENHEGLICTLDDVTYKKMMEEKINQNEKLAYTGTLAASLAHEIRNPLAGIRAGIQVINNHLERPNDRELCAGIVGEVDRVNLLIENLLNLSRKRESQKSALAVSKLFDAVFLLYSKVAENANVQFQVICDEPVRIYADESELKQVLINLINNSLKAMPEGGALTLTAKIVDGFPMITLEDTGRGMTQSLLDSLNSGTHARGLGLHIVRQLLLQNGGEFSIFSVPNSGTTITITFKRQD